LTWGVPNACRQVRSGVVLPKLKNTNKNPIHIVKTSSQPNQKTNIGWDW
jgi:hypothetical protein